MAIVQAQPKQIKRTLGVKHLNFSGKRTAMNLSNDINRRLSTETSTETSGRK